MKFSTSGSLRPPSFKNKEPAKQAIAHDLRLPRNLIALALVSALSRFEWEPDVCRLDTERAKIAPFWTLDARLDFEAMPARTISKGRAILQCALEQ